MRNGQWTWNTSDEGIWQHNYFESKEEALEDAKINVEEEIEGVYVGQVKEFAPHVSAYSIIDQLQEDACELCGEASDYYLNKISSEQEQELTDMMTSAFNVWSEKYNHDPSFYSIDNMSFVEFNKVKERNKFWQYDDLEYILEYKKQMEN